MQILLMLLFGDWLLVCQAILEGQGDILERRPSAIARLAALEPTDSEEGVVLSEPLLGANAAVIISR